MHSNTDQFEFIDTFPVKSSELSVVLQARIAGARSVRLPREALKHKLRAKSISDAPS